MRDFINTILEYINPQPLFEMTNLRSEETGLPFVVFISQKAGARHDVRVKVSDSPRVKKRGMISVAIRPDIRVVAGSSLSAKNMKLLSDWINLNRETIIRFWDGDIEYSSELLRLIVPLPPEEQQI